MIVELVLRLFLGEPLPASTGFVPERELELRDGDWECGRCTSVMRRYRRCCSGCGQRRAREAPLIKTRKR